MQTMTETELSLGISIEAKREIAQELSKVLADSYALYLKTQGHHWNITGPLFHDLHNLFGQQYKELAEAIDEIAERIRSLGETAPASFDEFKNLTSIFGIKSYDCQELSKCSFAVNDLLEAHQILVRTIRHALNMAKSFEDYTSEDLLSSRLRVHEKQTWILSSLLPSQ